MVHGPFTTVPGPFTVVNGLFTVMPGLFTVVNGLFTVVNGPLPRCTGCSQGILYGNRCRVQGTSPLPTKWKEGKASTTREWLDLDQGRLFTARIDWLKLTYTFTARWTAQQSDVERNAALYAPGVQARDRSRSLSASTS